MTNGQIRILAGGCFALATGFTLARLARQRAFSFRGRTVVITGGSRGLGLELAREFASEGARLVLLARDEDELARAESELSPAGARVLAVRCDVRERSEVSSAIDRAAREFGRIDVLVNNAGIIQVGPLDHMTREDFENAMAVHFRGPLETMLAVLPHLRRVGGGRIVNIASIGGKIALPHMVPYTASKFALVGLSDGFRAELRRENILVTTVCPGLMRTGSPPNAMFKGRHRREYAWFAIADSLPLLSMGSRRAARKIVSACRRGSARLVVGVPAKAAVLFSEMFPGAAAALAAVTNRVLPKADPSGDGTALSGRDSESEWSRSVLTRASERAARRNNELPAQL